MNPSGGIGGTAQHKRKYQTYEEEAAAAMSASTAAAASPAHGQPHHPFPKKLRTQYDLSNGGAQQSPLSSSVGAPSPFPVPQSAGTAAMSQAFPSYSQQPVSPVTPLTAMSTFSNIGDDFQVSQNQAKVLAEQKIRLAMKVKIQNRRISELEEQIQAFYKERNVRECTLNVILSSWSAILRDLGLLSQRIPPAVDVDAVVGDVSASAASSMEPPSPLGSHVLDGFLQRLIQAYRAPDESATIVAEELRRQVREGQEKSRQIVESIVDAIRTDRARVDELVRRISADLGANKREQSVMLIKEDSKKVRSENESLQKSLDEVQNELRQLSHQHAALQEELARTKRDLDQATQDSEQTRLNLEKSHKQVVRLQLQIEEMRTQGVQPGTQASTGAADGQGASQSSSSQAAAAVALSPLTGTQSSVFSDEDMQKVISSFKDDNQHLKAALAERNKELEATLKRCAQLETDLARIEREKTEEQHIFTSAAYKNLLERYHMAKVFTDEQNKTIQDYMKKTSEVEKERDDWKTTIMREFESKVHQIEQDLKKANEHIGQLRKERDSLQRDRKHAEQQPEALLKKQIATLQADFNRINSRNTELSKENALYKEDKGSLVLRITTLQQALVQRPSSAGGRQAQASSSSTDGMDINQLQEQLAAQKEECEALTQALDELSSHCTALDEEKEKLHEQIRKYEENNTDMVRDKILQQQRENQLKQERDALQQEVKGWIAAHDTLKNQSIPELQHRIDLLSNELQALKNEVLESRRLIDRQRQYMLLQKKTEEGLIQETERAREASRQAQALAEKTMQDAKTVEMKVKELEEQKEQLQKKLKKADKQAKAAAGASAASASLNDDVTYFKNLCYCSVCQSNQKNRIISRCHHAFCEKCIEDTVQARNRKCPTCKITFGKNDIEPLFL